MHKFNIDTVKLLLEDLVDNSKYYFYDDKYEHHISNLRKAISYIDEKPDKVFKEDGVEHE